MHENMVGESFLKSNLEKVIFIQLTSMLIIIITHYNIANYETIPFNSIVLSHYSDSH